MPFYANACRVKNQRICRSRKIWRPPPVAPTAMPGGLLLTAADISPHGHEVLRTGFSNGDSGGPPAGGSLVPPGIAGTDVLVVTTLDGPIWPQSAPRQLHLRLTGIIPTSVIFTGGDLTKSYTLRLGEADIEPPMTPNTWAWYKAFSKVGGGFLFTPNVTYTLFFN